MNPYYNQDFFGFIKLFFERLFLGGLFNPAPDEVQALVLIGVSLSCSLIGTFLVLRKMTMLANSLSHTLLLGIVLAYLFAGGEKESLQVSVMPLLLAALFMGFVTVFLTEWLTSSVKLQEDASIGLIFTTLFALGIVAVSVLTRSAHIGTESVMGNVDALHPDDLKLVCWVLLANVLLVGLFFKEYKLVSFDPVLASALGFSVPLFNNLMMAQASFAIIGSFRSTGVLMVLAFLVLPPLTARLWTHHFGKMVALSLVIGAGVSLTSVALSRHILSVEAIALSTAGLTVVMLTLVFALSVIFKRVLKV